MLPLFLGKCKNIIDKWTLLRTIDIQPIMNEYYRLRLNINELEKALTLDKTEKMEVMNFAIITEFLFDEIDRKLNQLIPQSRSKRGLINGLGSVWKSITGNLDNEDGERIEQHLENLDKNQLTLKQTLESQITLTTKAIEKFESSITNLTTNQLVLRSRILQIEQALKNQKVELYHRIQFSNVYMQINTMAQSILQILETLEEAVTFAKINVMHPSIIEPEDLLDSLLQISKYVNLPVPVVKEQILNFEALITIKAYWKKTKLNFILEVPIIDTNQYNLYHLYSCPILHQNNTFQLIIPNKKYLVLSDQYYSSSNELCKLIDNHFYCNNLDLINLETNQPCEVQLLLAKRPYSNCQINLIRLTSQKVQTLECNQLLLINPSDQQINFKCKDLSETRILTSGTYIVTNQNNCVIQISNQKFAHIQTDILNQRNIYIPELDYKVNVSYNYEIKNISLSQTNLDDLHIIKYKMEQNKQNLNLINSTSHWYQPSLWTILLYVTLICFSIYIIRRIRKRLQDSRDNPKEESPRTSAQA